MRTNRPKRWSLVAVAAVSATTLLAAVPVAAHALVSPMAVQAGDAFTESSVKVAGVAVPTRFEVTAPAAEGDPGTVSIGDGTRTAISTTAAGELTIPTSVTHDGLVYRITAIADRAFRGAVAITSTGLAGNTSVESIGDYAFANAYALTDTGLGANESVLEVGTGAFASARALRHGALPASLENAPSVPFTSATSLQSAYLPSSFPKAKRVGLKTSLPVYFRAGADGWETSAAAFAGLSLYGAKPSELIALGSVTVTGGEVSAGETVNPHHAATGLFAAQGVRAGGADGTAADLVTVTAANPEQFSGWKVSGIELSAEQLASPTVTFAMPAADVSFEPATAVETVTTVGARCVAGKAYLYVSVRNDDTAPVSLDLTTSYGSKSISNLAAGKTVTSTFNSRQIILPAGEVTVAAHTSDGRSSTGTTAYPTVSCGALQ